MAARRHNATRMNCDNSQSVFGAVASSAETGVCPTFGTKGNHRQRILRTQLNAPTATRRLRILLPGSRHRTDESCRGRAVIPIWLRSAHTLGGERLTLLERVA